MSEDTRTRLSSALSHLAPDDLALLDHLAGKLLNAAPEEDIPLMPELKAALMEVPQKHRKTAVELLINNATVIASVIKYSNL